MTVRHRANDQTMPAVLLFGDTECFAAVRHEVPLAIIDSLMVCERGGRRYVLAKNIERSRIERVLPDAEILDVLDFGMKELGESGLLPTEAEREVAVRVARHLGLREATIPADFPMALAGPAPRGGDPPPGRRPCRPAPPPQQGRRRARGDPGRAAGGRGWQRAAVQMLARARPGEGGSVYLDGAELLTEHVREALRAACAAAGAPAPPDVMITSVWNGFGNEPGSGPLPAGLRSRSTSGPGTKRAAAGPT